MASDLDQRRAILDEHRQVMEVVSRVDEWLQPQAKRDVAWARELARRVGDVVEQLKIHFSGDVEHSLFEELAVSAPHLTGKLTSLATEHEHIISQFREVAESALSAQFSEANAQRLEAAARKVIARLRRHEAEENEIVLQAIWEDLGAGD